ncbi:MAG: hypothetical protein JSS57_02795 [Proteobacteria bacterium]|nr:hypothetical protein [Pseudomonadota bacterium]
MLGNNAKQALAAAHALLGKLKATLKRLAVMAGMQRILAVGTERGGS